MKILSVNKRRGSPRMTPESRVSSSTRSAHQAMALKSRLFWYTRYMKRRFTFPKISASTSVSRGTKGPASWTLTHGDARRQQAQGHDPERPEDGRRPLLARPGVDKCRKGVEHEVLDHHLQHKDLGGLVRERVAVAGQSALPAVLHRGGKGWAAYRMYRPAEVDGTAMPNPTRP